MPNTRPRNRRALGERIPGETPRATGKTKATAVISMEEELADVGSLRKIPAPKFETVPDSEDELEQSPLQFKAPAESTPLPARLQRRALATLPGPSKLPTRRAYSPLPPSSPPSASSDLEYGNPPLSRPPILLTPPPEASEARDDDHPLHDNKENEFNGDENENVLPVPYVPAPVEESSEDDPFGFSALERRLKSQREARRHSFVPLPEAQPVKKGKEPMRLRAPLGELSYDRAPSTSAATVKKRHPTPYHQSDDLEDMYLNPSDQPKSGPADEEDENANMSPPTGLEGLEAEMDEEEEAELERERRRKEKGKAAAESLQRASSVSEIDPLRTPQPRHVANIYPLRSPFSSVEGTPCDRSLADSPLSSPSPVKPLTVLHTLPVSTMKRGLGSSPVKTGPRPLVEMPSTKRRRVTLGKENSLVLDPDESLDSLTAAKELEKLLSKQPIMRRSGRITTATNTKAVSQAKVPVQQETQPPKRGRGRPPKNRQALVLGSTGIQETSEYEESREESPLVRRKRKAVAKEVPTKRAKTVKTHAAPASHSSPPKRRGRPPNSALSRNKPASKGKGKAKAKPSVVEDEDSDEARRRQERIEYFRKLDEISLEKEDVFVI